MNNLLFKISIIIYKIYLLNVKKECKQIKQIWDLTITFYQCEAILVFSHCSASLNHICFYSIKIQNQHFIPTLVHIYSFFYLPNVFQICTPHILITSSCIEVLRKCSNKSTITSPQILLCFLHLYAIFVCIHGFVGLCTIGLWRKKSHYIIFHFLSIINIVLHFYIKPHVKLLFQKMSRIWQLSHTIFLSELLTTIYSISHIQHILATSTICSTIQRVSERSSLQLCS